MLSSYLECNTLSYNTQDYFEYHTPLEALLFCYKLLEYQGISVQPGCEVCVPESFLKSPEPFPGMLWQGTERALHFGVGGLAWGPKFEI